MLNENALANPARARPISRNTVPAPLAVPGAPTARSRKPSLLKSALANVTLVAGSVAVRSAAWMLRSRVPASDGPPKMT